MIKSLTITNFKCYHGPVKMPFSRITLFTGQNGRGKSTVFQALLSLAQSIDLSGVHELRLNGGNVQLGGFYDVLNRNAQEESFTIEVLTDDTIDSNLVFNFIIDEDNDSFAKINHFLVDEKDFVIDEDLITLNGEPFEMARGEKLQFRHLLPTSDVVGLLSFRQLYYISADRLGPVNSVDYIGTSSFDSVGSRGEFVLNLLEKKGPEFQEEVRYALSDILDGASLEVKSEGNKVVIRMDSSDEGAFFKPTNVGYGYGYLLTTITSIINATDKSIIIIENPEAHLHPAAQSRLMSFLIKNAEKKGMQFFIETHSDHIVNGLLVALKEKRISVMDAGILFFDRNDMDGESCVEVSSLELTPFGRVRRPPIGFCDQYGIDLRKLI